MSADPIALARAFNEGSDARLMGIGGDSCWYKSEPILKEYWRLGWEDVDRNWGAEARCPVKPLRVIP